MTCLYLVSVYQICFNNSIGFTTSVYFLSQELLQQCLSFDSTAIPLIFFKQLQQYLILPSYFLYVQVEKEGLQEVSYFTISTGKLNMLLDMISLGQILTFVWFFYIQSTQELQLTFFLIFTLSFKKQEFLFFAFNTSIIESIIFSCSYYYSYGCQLKYYSLCLWMGTNILSLLRSLIMSSMSFSLISVAKVFQSQQSTPFKGEKDFYLFFSIYFFSLMRQPTGISFHLSISSQAVLINCQILRIFLSLSLPYIFSIFNSVNKLQICLSSFW